MIDDKISCRQSLKRKGDFLGKNPHERCSFACEYTSLKKEIHVLYFWISILVIIGKRALLANADSKDLCLEQTFFKIVLEAFCKLTKNCSISALLELEKKSCSERFRMYCILLIHLGAFILGIIFDVMLLLDMSYTRALALY